MSSRGKTPSWPGRTACTVSPQAGCFCRRAVPTPQAAIVTIVLLASLLGWVAVSAADPPGGVRVDEDGRVVGGDRPTVLNTSPYVPDGDSSGDPTATLPTPPTSGNAAEENGSSVSGGKTSADDAQTGSETPPWESGQPLTQRVLYWSRLALIGLIASVVFLIVMRWGRKPSATNKPIPPVDSPSQS